LQELTQSVASGHLEASVEMAGPREIADLADSFNRMMASLRQSREETRNHIASLQKVNDELIRSEKMASVGHLAAGMAHEIGNPLGAIVGYLELLKSDLSDPGQRDLAGRSLVEAGRIDRLVRELLDFAAPSTCCGEVFDPVAVAGESLELLQNQGVLEGRRLEARLPAKLPCVRMVRHRLQQVLVNLLINARDATEAGDLIRLEGGVDQDTPWLSVRDAGSGIAPEVLPHLFDPFYTTKASGQGRGLGLAICQRIIEEAGGRIEVTSEPGRGSEFRVWIKRSEE
jgi:signal transduction histidine kinase